MLYYLLLPLIYGISYLPFWALYLISDFLYLIAYRMLGYRRELVTRNLKASFPEKSDAEIAEIQDKFYRFLGDALVETIKTLTISPKALRKHIEFANQDLIRDFYEKGQSVAIITGHFGSWELSGARFAIYPYHKLNVIYHPISNKNFDRLLYKMRTRLGNGLYPMKDTIRCMIRDRDQITATAFISDQASSPHNSYWTTFLNQDTPVFWGPARIPSKFEYPVIFSSVRRIKRGKYVINHHLLTDRPQDMSLEELTELHVRCLERDIREQPELWLWTHNRWKHNRPE